MNQPLVLHAKAIGQIQRAIALREQAAETRLRIWLTRLSGMAASPADETLERALDASLSVASADCANIQRIHPSGKGLVLRAQRGFEQPFLDYFEYVHDGTSACGLALEERRPVVVDDVFFSPVFSRSDARGVLLDAGIRSVKSMPLVGRSGECLGMLSVHYRNPRKHAHSDLTRLVTLAARVSALIQRTGL